MNVQRRTNHVHLEVEELVSRDCPAVLTTTGALAASLPPVAGAEVATTSLLPSPLPANGTINSSPTTPFAAISAPTLAPPNPGAIPPEPDLMSLAMPSEVFAKSPFDVLESGGSLAERFGFANYP